MTASDRADVWVLLGPHAGDNNQVLALAEALGLPFRAIQMRYRPFAHLPAVLRSATIAQLLPDSRREIAAPWPRLVLGIGQRSAPVGRYIQKASGGRTKHVRLGDPMVSPRLFDLVVTTTQYAVREAPNVIRLPITVTGQEDVQPNKAEQQWLQNFAHPRRLLVIGGKTSMWRFDDHVVLNAANTLRRRAEREGGSVIAVTSPRTSPALKLAARRALGDNAVVTELVPRYAALLHAADEIHVTGDSVSMLSDAVATGKPVGLIPLKPDTAAHFLQLLGRVQRRQIRMRDLNKFWNDLRARGLVGTLENPRAASLDVSPIDTAVAAVHALIEKGQKIVPARRRAARAAQPAAEPVAL